MEPECPVCFENLSRTIHTIFPCRHSLCLSCLTRMKRPHRCPLCRDDLAPYMPERPLRLLTEPTSPPTHLSIIIQRQISRMEQTEPIDLEASALMMPSPILPPPEERPDEAGLTSRTDSIVFEVSPPQTSDDPSVMATLRARTVQPSDLPNARVTRNSIFMRSDLSA